MKYSLAQLVTLLPLVLACETGCSSWQPVTDNDKAVAHARARAPDQAEMLLRQMHTMLAAATTYLEKARTDVHVRRIVCVGEARSIIRSTVSQADRHHLDYIEGVGTGDRALAEHALLKISIAHARVDMLHGQLMGCGGPVE